MLRELTFVGAVIAGLATASPASAATGAAPTIADVTPHSATARTGSSFTFQVIAENERKTASTPYGLNFLISSTGGPSGARKIGEGTIPAIAAKTRKTFTFTKSIPSNAAAGDFRLLLCHPRPGQTAYCHDDRIQLKVTLGPAKLTITPAGANFGSVPINSTSGTETFIVRNIGRRASNAVTVSLSGTQKSSFEIVATTCGASLAPSATCKIRALARPTSTGLRKAALKATPAAKYSSGATVTLSVTGFIPPANLVFTPSGEDFGDVVTGETSAPKTFTITNTGGVSSGALLLTIIGPDSAYFLPYAPDTTCVEGVSLDAGASCDVSLQFAPVTARDYAATYMNFTNPGTPPGGQPLSLVGTGITPAHLEWSASSTDFGDVPFDSAPTRTLTLKNTGEQTSGVPQIQIVGTDATDFSVDTASSTCTAALAHNETCDVVVKLFAVFDPVDPDLEAELQASADPGTTGPLATTLSAHLVGP